MCVPDFARGFSARDFPSHGFLRPATVFCGRAISRAVRYGRVTQRKPRWFVPVLTSPLPRVPTMYREQY